MVVCLHLLVLYTHCTRCFSDSGGFEAPESRDVLEGGGQPPPPNLQGALPMPSHCLPDGKCQPQWHL